MEPEQLQEAWSLSQEPAARLSCEHRENHYHQPGQNPSEVSPEAKPSVKLLQSAPSTHKEVPLMEMPQPSETHKNLARLAGDWSGEEKIFPSQWSPEGASAEAVHVARVSLNGFVVVEDYEQKSGGETTFSGHGVWTVDSESGDCLLYWFDCLGTGMELFCGSWEGDVMTLLSHGPSGHFRLTYDLTDPEIIRTGMETSHDGEQWTPMMEGAFTQK
jgi:hypothetical protein